MSQYKLTQAEKDLLALGTKFIPTPTHHPDGPDFKDTLLRDWEIFKRRCRIRYQFDGKSNVDYIPKFHIPNTNFQPDIFPNSALEKWLASTETLLLQRLNYPINRARKNLPRIQSIFLRQLHDNPDLVIKPADKNIGLTLMDRTQYDNEVYRQLNDHTTYKPIPSIEMIPIPIIYERIVQIFRRAYRYGVIPNVKLLKYIEQYVTPESARLPHFYILPKVHKGPPIKGRPLVPSTRWITTPASRVIDYLLQPLCKKYIETLTTDSTQIVRELESLIISDAECPLFTADVTSLYTNIDIPDGLDEVKNFLNMILGFNNPEDRLIPELRDLILEVLRIILKNNYFSFRQQYFLQLIGTAMGTPAAVVFANIYMFMKEKKVIERNKDSIRYYRRFLDDILIIFNTHNPQPVIDQLNNMHPSIKLESVISKDKVNFLDLIIHKGNRFKKERRLDISCHQKTLNSYLYIPFNSFHPPRSKGGFIITELKRYVRNNSSRSEYLKLKLIFYLRLRARGYPTVFLNDYFGRVQYDERSELIKQKQILPDDDETLSSPSDSTIYFTTLFDDMTHRLRLTRLLNETRKSHPMGPRQKDHSTIPYKAGVGYKVGKSIWKTLCSNMRDIKIINQEKI